MTQQIINVGSAPNDSTGDPIRTAWIKANGNFTELYGAPVRVDIPQSLTDTQQTQARSNIFAAPFDALAYNGMQINGGFEVSQEIGSAGILVSGAPCDGWRTYWAGTMALTAAQTSFLIAGFPVSFGILVRTAQASLGASDVAQVYQLIEGYRVARLAWGSASAQPLTIGFWTAHHHVGIYSVVVLNGTQTRYYATTYTQNNPDSGEYKVITIPGDTTGTWAKDNTSGLILIFTMAAGSAITAPVANAWGAGSYNAAPGQVNGVSSTAEVFRLAGVVVLPGIEAPSAARSAFIMRPYDQELPTCQRYWQQLKGQIVDTSLVMQTAIFPVAMRTTPTITGGGAGFGSSILSSTAGSFYQTARGYQDLNLDARL